MLETAQRSPRELVADVERLLGEIESLPEQPAREKATEVVQALLDLYGAGLERIVEEIAARDDGGLASALADDELVSHLLLLHGLHPVGVEERVVEALASVRPYLESHGGDVELLGVEGQTVRLRLQGSCSGCPSSTMTLKLAIENAIQKAAPEIEEVQAQDDQPAAPSLIQLEMAPGLAVSGEQNVPGEQNGSSQGPSPGSPADPAWTMAGALKELPAGGSAVKTIAGQPILFLRIQDQLYAYRPGCPACETSLAGAELRALELRCPGCGRRFDAMRAGRCLDSPQLHLEPVPLLVGEDDLVKIALGPGG